MSTAWLNERLRNGRAITTDGGSPILTVNFHDRTERIYCPNSTEYRVTAEVVNKAKELGATIVAYSSAWCGTTYEAKQYAKKKGIIIMHYASFFAYLREHGVVFPE